METEYRDFVRYGPPMRLNEESVEYVVLGGHAVIAHGYLRTTGDVDIFVNPQPDNAVRLLRVVERYGYTNGEFELEDFVRVLSFLSFSRHDGYIDIMTFTLGVTFDECYQNRLVLAAHGVSINLRELIKNKQAVGRPWDLRDLDNLPAHLA